mgnify:CR=1 FL=1
MTFSDEKPTMIEFKDVHKYYGDYHALRGINGTIKAGEAATLQALTGKPDMTQVVTAVSNAEVTLQAAVAVRDKVIQAYLDVIRMPI